MEPENDNLDDDSTKSRIYRVAPKPSALGTELVNIFGLLGLVVGGLLAVYCVYELEILNPSPARDMAKSGLCYVAAPILLVGLVLLSIGRSRSRVSREYDNASVIRPNDSLASGTTQREIDQSRNPNVFPWTNVEESPPRQQIVREKSRLVTGIINIVGLAAVIIGGVSTVISIYVLCTIQRAHDGSSDGPQLLLEINLYMNFALALIGGLLLVFARRRLRKNKMNQS